MTPIWDQLGADMAASKDTLTIAKIDATANDFSRTLFPVSGYPTIFFLPANKKNAPVKYQGARELADFKTFLKQQQTAKP